MQPIYIIVIAVLVFVVTLAAILRRYKRCPSDKILVIYGKTGKNKAGGVSSARCIHGGAAFIWPVFQSYAFLDLKPFLATMEPIPLKQTWRKPQSRLSPC